MKKTKKLCIVIAILLIINIISLSALLVNGYKTVAKNDEFLNKIKIGHSEEYINSKLGIPETAEIFRSEETDSDYKKVGYNLDNNVLFCIYEQGILKGFCVIGNGKPPYSIGTNETALGSFTYDEFSPFPLKYSANVAVSSLTASYYCEFYEGNDANDYNYTLLGSYIVFENKSNLILHAGQDSLRETESEYKMTQELKELRATTKPNVYAEISRELIDIIDAPLNFATENAQQIFYNNL